MKIGTRYHMMYSFPENFNINSSDKFYFTCSSYGFISPILSLIDKIISKSSDINIIVMDEQMDLFWRQLITNRSLEWNLIYINTKLPGRYRNVLSWLKIKPAIKKLFEDNFKAVRNSHFFCCGHVSDLILFSLVKLLAKQNNIVFLNIFYSDTYICYSLKSLLLLVHTWLFYDIDVSIRCSVINKSPQIYLSELFFKKINAQLYEFKYHYDPSLLQKYYPIPTSYTSDKKIMWLDDDSCIYERKMQSHSLTCLKAIKSIVDSNFANNEVLYKRHPSQEFHSKGFAAIYSDYLELPSFINADFVISNPNIKFILGGFSAVLCTAAKNSNIKAISYVKMIPFEDQNFTRHMVEYWMKESDQKILFPDSLEELKNMIVKRETTGDA
ncbi:MAG: hypothetical protein AB2L12_10375 [Smithellaceae bacterium]